MKISTFLLSAATLITGFAFGPVLQAEDYRSQYKRPGEIPHPEDNQFTEARYELGRALFFDPRLSGSNWISCATCHNPAFSYEDGLPKGIGHGMVPVGRSTPTVLNLAWGELYFWDGRAESLEEQALGPIEAAGEMNLPHDVLIKKLNAIKGYQPMFEAAYKGDGISTTAIGKALAQFQRTLISGTAPFDRYVSGDNNAISASAKRGFQLFNEKALCSECHSSWRFTDDSFHDIGVLGDDPGRGAILEGVDSLKFAFKTPTLRNSVERAPFMHDGSEATLEEVIDFYNRGGDAGRPNQSEHVRKLNLTSQEKADLVEFLKTLSSKDKEVAAPILPQ